MNKNISLSALHLRNVYSALLSNGTVGHVPDNFETSFRGIKYNPLTAWNLVDTDYFRQTKKNGTRDPQNWFTNEPPPTEDDFNFVAQTLVTSSYGLMQIMYPTAVREMNYQKNGIGLDPLRLLIPSTNVDVGSGYLAKQYLSASKVQKTNIITFQNLDSYLGALMSAATLYNGGTRGLKNYQPLMYSISVDAQTKNYWITQPAVFGN